MKLSSLKPSVAQLKLINAQGEATDVVLNLIGQDTKPFRDKARAIAKGMVGKTAKDVDLDILEKHNTELAATCLVGWVGLQDDEGNDIIYTPQAALELMNDPELAFIKEQVEEFIAERKNFFR